MAQDSFADLATQHLQCRDWGHAWKALRTTVEQMDLDRVYLIALECTRCTTQKVMAVQQDTGERIASGYRYVEGYLIADIRNWGGRRLFNANVRKALYERLAETPKPQAQRSRRRTTK